MAANGSNDFRDGFGVHQTGCAAAKEYGVQDAAFGFGCCARQFGQISVAPCFLINGAGDVAVEIAIGAFGLAKRPVDVETKAALLPVFSQNSPSAASQRKRHGG